MPAFTKGKWSYADVSTPYEQHFIIGTVDKTGTFHAHASTKTEADARLFSAAPDLYSLMWLALSYMYDYRETSTNMAFKHMLTRDIQRIEDLLRRIDLSQETTSHDAHA